jgi:hypothetical protein
MSSNFETVATDLEEYLKESLPQTWKVLNINQVTSKTTGLTVTHSLTGFSNKNQGQQLPYEWLTADFTVDFSSPNTDLIKGQAQLLTALPELFKALDNHPELTWETARKGVTDKGETVFTIDVQILVTTHTEDS